jgi:MoxR-like ATPase
MTYYLRDSDSLFLRVLTQPRRNGVRAGLISGAPGVGKTALGRHFADQLGGTLEYYLCHHWTSEEDLFIRIDPARVAALAGGVDGVRMEDAYRAGVLLRAVLSSHDNPVVVLIDELDKAPERVDALLLEFLQAGRVYGPYGEVWEANLDQLVVIITNNGVRPISEPLLRRVFRYEMPYLPPAVEADIIRHETGAAVGVCRLIVQMMAAIRERGQSSPSLQEGIRLAEALPLARSSEEVELLLRGWLCKTDADWAALVELCGDQPASVLFGEVKRGGV